MEDKRPVMAGAFRNRIRHGWLELLLFAVPGIASAQCAAGSLIGLGQVSPMTGNPFRAEVRQTYKSEEARLTQALTAGEQKVARDSQGRTRIDVPTGRFRTTAESGESSEETQHMITVCDPVKGEWITLDTLDKTATIIRGRPAPSSAGTANRTHSSDFCSRQFGVAAHSSDSETRDLGHRAIEGIDAVGVLQKSAMIAVPYAGNGSAEKQPIGIREMWCSEELGTVVLNSTGTEEEGFTTTFVMVNIQRGEPDAVLFEIPPDYRILEKQLQIDPRQGDDRSLKGTSVQKQTPDNP